YLFFFTQYVISKIYNLSLHDALPIYGMNALEKEKDEEAIAFFETALEEKPEDEIASQYIEETEVIMDGFIALEEGNLEEAKSFFNEFEHSEDSISTLQARSKDALHTIDELEAD